MKLKKYLKDKYYLESKTNVDEIKKDLSFVEKKHFNFRKLLLPISAFATVVLVITSFIFISQNNYSSVNSDSRYEIENNLEEYQNKDSSSNNSESKIGAQTDTNIEENPQEEQGLTHDEDSAIDNDSSKGNNPSDIIAPEGGIANNPGAYAGIGDIDIITPISYTWISNFDSNLDYSIEFFEEYVLLSIKSNNGSNYYKFEIKDDNIYIYDYKEFSEDYQYFEILRSDLKYELNQYKIIINSLQ